MSAQLEALGVRLSPQLKEQKACIPTQVSLQSKEQEARISLQEDADLKRVRHEVELIKRTTGVEIAAES